MRSAALTGAAALVHGPAQAAVGGLERALHEPVALARVRADGRIDELSSFDLACRPRSAWVDVILHPGDRERLRAAGFAYDVVVEDLVAADLAARDAERRAQAADPSQRLLYRTYAEHVADLHRLAADHPALVRLIELPYPTHEGRRVYAVEICDGDGDDGRPGFEIDGVHHAREWPSGELPVMFAEDLVSRFVAGEARVVALMRAIRVFVVPVVNPDGFVRSRETVSDFLVPVSAASATSELAYHRKNLRRNSNLAVEIAQGVDPNRNYPFRWGGPGSSGSTTSQTYRGPLPASEPETRNLLWLLRTHQVQSMVSNHTYGNLVLRPWGHTEADPPDEAVLRDLGRDMAAFNGYESIKGIGLYPTTGTTDDWFYAVTGGIGYTFEHGSGDIVRGGFHPQYNLNIPVFYERNAPAFLLLAEAAADETLHCVLEGTAPAGSVLTLRKSAYVPYGALHVNGLRGYTEELTYRLTVPPSGAFRWHVNPSPLPETVDAVRRGVLPASALEPYTLTCAGDTRTFVAVRGSRHTFTF